MNKKPFGLIDIQMFAETQDESGANAQTTTAQTAQQTDAVSKATFDRVMSEAADLKRKLKELQDKGKTDEEIAAQRLLEAQAELEKKEKEINERNKKLCRATATALVAEAKSKLTLDKDGQAEFDSIFEALIGENEETTTAQATAFGKLIMRIYQQGIDAARVGNVNSHTAGFTVGGANNGSSTMGKKMAEQANNRNEGKTTLFTQAAGITNQ